MKKRIIIYNTNMWSEKENKEFTKINMIKGEVLCDRCDGSGVDPEPHINDYDWTELCHKCSGNGAVDWVKQLTWKG